MVTCIDIIDKKRLGQAHSSQELATMVGGIVDGSIPDYQAASWLMAVCCRGMTDEEATELTRLYVESGQTLDWSDVDGVVVDKHSTGGVGDKTTLVVAPMLAACGLKVAKLSGRGLGFTGGTVDKLEAIPGFNVTLTTAKMRDQVREIGLALGTQTGELAPADGKIYALRDVTATVASIPLIAASVVSKKIAAGAQVITLDIKWGSGAFMKTLEDANALAKLCQFIGQRLGRSMATVISSMEAPLGHAIGHTIEVIEAIETLKNQGPEDLTELSVMLVAVSLFKASKASSLDEAKIMAQNSLTSGSALKAFRDLIKAQGGDERCVDDYTRFPHANTVKSVMAEHAGVIHHCDALSLAKAAKALGAGRLTKSAPIDLAVGVKTLKKLGESVQVGDVLAELWSNGCGEEEAMQWIQQAFEVQSTPLSGPCPSLVDSVHLQ